MSRCIFCNGETDLINHRVVWMRFSDDVYGVDKCVHEPAKRSSAHSLTVPVCKKHHGGLHFSGVTRIGDFSEEFPDLAPAQVQHGYDIIEDAIRLSWLVPLVDITLIGHDYFEVVSKIGSYASVIEQLTKSSNSGKLPMVYHYMFGIPLSPTLKSLAFEQKPGDYRYTLGTTRGDFVKHHVFKFLVSRSVSMSHISEDYLLKYVNGKREILLKGNVMVHPVKNMKTPIRKAEVTSVLNELVHDERVVVKLTKNKNHRYPIRNYRYIGDV